MSPKPRTASAANAAPKKPYSGPKDASIEVYLPASMKTALQARADAEDRELSTYVRLLLAKHLEGV